MNLPNQSQQIKYDKIIKTLVKTTKVVADFIMQDTCDDLRANSSSDAIKMLKYLQMEHDNAGDIPH